MNTRWWWMSAAAVVGLCGLLTSQPPLRAKEEKAEQRMSAEPTERVKRFLGARAVEVLSSADMVGVYRLGQPDTSGEAGGGDTLQGFPIIARGGDQDADFAARVRAVLFDERTYDFRSAKGCEFQPGVAFRFTGESGEVDVILCFKCNELDIHSAGPGGKDATQAGEDFDRARPMLVQLAKESFPEDQEIQALEEEAE